jgi:hypothetical protein
LPFNGFAGKGVEQSLGSVRALGQFSRICASVCFATGGQFCGGKVRFCLPGQVPELSFSSAVVSQWKQTGDDTMRRIYNRAGAVTALVTALAWAAPTTAQTPDPKGCTPQERSNRTLNEDGQKSAGVICPPDVDPNMKAPAPKTGDTSIVTPPGSSGTAPNVQPK